MRHLPPLPDDIIDQLNRMRGGFNEALALRFTQITYEEILAEIPVGPHLLQPYGLVHGGVYAAMIETLASTGAALNARANAQHTVGLENNTSFLKGVRTGTLRGRATPLTRGRKSQVWSATIHDDGDRLVAQGRVRLLCLDEGGQVAGETVEVKTS